MKTNIGIIGAGNMGAAIIDGIKAKYKVCICEKDTKRAQLVKRRFKIISCGLKELSNKSSIIILAVKPQNFEEVLGELKQYLTRNGKEK